MEPDITAIPSMPMAGADPHPPADEALLAMLAMEELETRLPGDHAGRAPHANGNGHTNGHAHANGHVAGNGYTNGHARANGNGHAAAHVTPRWAVAREPVHP